MGRFFLVMVILISSLVCGCVPKGAYNSGHESSIENLVLQTKRHPESAMAHAYLCKALVKNQQYKEAIEPCQKALRLPSNVKDPEREAYLWNALGVAYGQTGQAEEAIAAVKKFIELQPNEAIGYENLASYYNKNKQYDEAITAAKRAIELAPDSEDSYFMLGLAYGGKEKYTEAMNALRKSLKLNPKQPGVSAWLGLCLERMGNYDEAARAYTDGIRQGGDLRDKLARLYYRTGRYDMAIVTATEAVEQQTIRGIGINIRITSGYPVVGAVVNKGPAFRAGIQAGDRIVEIDGNPTEGWTAEKVTQTIKGSVGTQIILTVGRSNNTIKKTVTREAMVQEGAAVSMSIRSLAYRHKGAFDKAANDAGAAMDIAPSEEWGLLALGAASLDSSQYDRAIQLLSKVKDSPTAVILKATALAKKGSMAEAVQVYLSVPGVSPAEKNIPLAEDRQALLRIFKPAVTANMGKAKSFEAKKMNREALSALAEALKMADDSDAQVIQGDIFRILKSNPLLADIPETARKHALRAELLIKDGKFSQAVTEYKKAIQIAPYVPKLYYNCAQVSAEIKNYPEAIRHMKTYLMVAADAPDVRKAKDDIIMWELMMEKAQ